MEEFQALYANPTLTLEDRTQRTRMIRARVAEAGLKKEWNAELYFRIKHRQNSPAGAVQPTPELQCSEPK